MSESVNICSTYKKSLKILVQPLSGPAEHLQLIILSFGSKLCPSLVLNIFETPSSSNNDADHYVIIRKLLNSIFNIGNQNHYTGDLTKLKGISSVKAAYWRTLKDEEFYLGYNFVQSIEC
jgi:hypothetical protein